MNIWPISLFRRGNHKLGHPRTIAVFRALHLSDLLCAVPAFRALHTAFPRAEITLVGLPWARSFVQRFSKYLDGFLEFPGYPGLSERHPAYRFIPDFFRETQEMGFDVAIQMHGSGEISNPVTFLLGAKRTAGYYPAGQDCPDKDLFIPFDDRVHEITEQLRLLEFLGVPSSGTGLEFPFMEQDQRDFAGLEELEQLKGRTYVCIHPGARVPSRRWLPERFAIVAEALADRGLGIVVTGTAGEEPITHEILQRMRLPAVDLAGRTTLGSLAELLKRSRLLISNDTGVAQLAVALEVPSVIIANGTDAARRSPLNGDIHRVLHQPVACRPCSYTVCPIGHSCALGVSAESVINEALALLTKEHSRCAAKSL